MYSPHPAISRTIGNEASFAEIGKYISSFYNAAIKTQALSVEDIVKVMKQNIDFHKSIAAIEEKFDVSSLYSIEKKVKASFRNDKSGVITAYYKMCAGYQGKAKAADSTFFGALTKANKEMIKVLEMLVKNSNQLFDDKFISIDNTKVSNILVVSIMKQSTMLADYSNHVFGELCNMIRRDAHTVAPYKIKFILENGSRVTNIVNNLLAKENSYHFMRDLERFRKENNDLLVYANGNVFTNFINQFKILDPFGSLSGFFIPSLNFIAYISRVIDDYNHDRYLEHKTTHEWLIAHCSVLQYDLQNMDPNSEEYQKLLKVIKNYDQEIAKYHQKMDDYLNEE